MATRASQPKTLAEIETRVANGKLPAHRVARMYYYHSGDFKTAMGLARQAYVDRPRSLELEEIGNLLVHSGQEFQARHTFLSCLMLYGRLHTTNLVLCDIPVARAFVDDERRLLYIAIPKNASSTIKNYLSHCLDGETHGEQVHSKMLPHYRFVTPQDLATRYADYFKFTVVRDPVDRIASYYNRNVLDGAIQYCGYGMTEFQGLPSMPSPAQFMKNLNAYRRYFLGVRHHTDRQIKYLDGFLTKEAGLHVFGMGGVPTIRARLAEAYACEIPDTRFMVGEALKGPKPPKADWTPLSDQFKRDYAMFGEVFAGTGDPTGPYQVIQKRNVRPVYFNAHAEPFDANDLEDMDEVDGAA